ncbi:MAG: DNA polymerase/3'-5' exonuclease PolX [Anaerolineae bacterium]|nr:MAG: DNA polymerase/3'-5' exonuclease PolX [Anaerolineae bacterium]
MNNAEVAKVFEDIADLLEIKGEKVFKIIAYRRGAEAIRSQGRDIKAIWKEGTLEEIPGVGKAIAEKTDELLRTGKMEYYENLKSEIPIGLLDMLKVGDVGPKKAARFWKELDITSVEQLEAAAKNGELKKLSGMGTKSEARILESIEAMKRRQTGRMSIGVALPIAEQLLGELRRHPKVKAAETAGSLRRMRETVGDLDLLVSTDHPEEVMQDFVELPIVGRVRGKGAVKTSVELIDGVRVQVWTHPPERFGTALQYATGSKNHNLRLRELALSKGLSLSDQAFKLEDGGEITVATEAEVYEKLGLPWIAPEMREDRGEIQAAQNGDLPKLLEVEDLKGELHAHTTWSDGKNSIEEMVEAAIKEGHTYLAITDHSQSLGIANGLTAKRVEKQRKEIVQARKGLKKNFVLLHGTEMEILADGSLDYPDEVLARFDLVIASLHTSLRQPREQVTERILSAIRNPHVDILAHPSGRLIGKREPADLDMDQILEAALEHGVILEINSNPERLDLNDIYARRAAEMGIPLAITTDAHRPEHLGFRRFGVGVARRAWVTSRQVVSCWTAARIQKWLKARG